MARSLCSFCTQGASSTKPTIGTGKFDPAHWISPGIWMRRPAGIGAPLRTDHLLCLPVQLKVCHIVALSSWCLPTGIRAHRTNHLNAQLVSAPDEQIGIHIPRIPEMFAWQERSLCSGLMSWGCKLTIRHACPGRFHVRDQVHLVIIACVGHLDFRAGPGLAALVAIGCFGIRGGIRA